MAQREHVGAGADERVHISVAGEQVVDDAVVHGIPPGAETGVDAGELPLHVTQRRLDGAQTQPRRRTGGDGAQRMRSSAARERAATSGGNAI